LSSIRAVGGSPVLLDFRGLTSRVQAGRPFFESGGFNLSRLDALVVRDMGAATSLDRVVFPFDVLLLLEEEGVVVVNPPLAIQRAANKHLASQLFTRQGLPVPPTLVTTSREEALAALEVFGCAVVKPFFGCKGQGIVRLQDRKRLAELLEEWGVLYIQKYIPHGGRDIRVFVAGGKAVAAIYRTGEGWITNISQGGRPEPCKLTPAQAEIAISGAEALGLEFAGMDLLEDRMGTTYLLEANATPSAAGIHRAAGKNVTDIVIENLVERLRS